jgi:hypothetical protein
VQKEKLCPRSTLRILDNISIETKEVSSYAFRIYFTTLFRYVQVIFGEFLSVFLYVTKQIREAIIDVVLSSFERYGNT